MGMYRKLSDREDIITNDESLEEQYQKMFKKIARDFVYKDDLRNILNFILLDLFPDRSTTINENLDGAVLRALEYKENQNKPINQRKKYKDVIDDE